MIPGIYDCFKHWHEKGTVFIISDPHFADSDTKHLEPNRPSDEELVKRINAKVGRADTLIILGDCGDPAYIQQLRGYKVLIAGNHDQGLTNYQKSTVQILYDRDKYTRTEALAEAKKEQPNCKYTITEIFTYEKPNYFWRVDCCNNLFDEVYSGPLFIGERLLLSHEPIDLPYALNLHGHDHSGWHSGGNKVNFCANVIGYEPINFNQFMKSGSLANIDSIHRQTIDTATLRKKKRTMK